MLPIFFLIIRHIYFFSLNRERRQRELMWIFWERNMTKNYENGNTRKRYIIYTQPYTKTKVNSMKAPTI